MLSAHTHTFAPAPGARPSFVGDHPALDMLNTVAVVDDQMVDFWQTDEDVLNWLGEMNLVVPGEAPALKPLALRDAARGLRELVRTLLAQRKAEETVEIAALNDFLAHGHYQTQLVAATDGSVQISRRYEARSAEQVLIPLAESAAELLATGDFSLVRKCEHPDCVLHFYDRTKSHRRRWCSMAMCGNRHKVAQFRRRQEQ
ncbi:CGNR zinc finger domain-containing protein [Paraburkholderia sp. GAS334]|uniref:CGNR zinc finger domain-containing protein n=1 Tax=Paraburkholderia sp. GAS334 TaxID=3035131 RepID=UPI003D21C93A